MVVYAISLFIITSIYLLLKKICKSTESVNKYFLIIVGCFLIILSGLRSVNVGTDVKMYKTIFENCGKISLFEEVPSYMSGFWGYRLLCKVVYIISNGNYQIMILSSAAIIIYGNFKFIYCYSDNCIASVYYFVSLYHIFVSWNIVRQSIAISFFLISICYFDRKKYKTFLLLSLLAISIHNVSVLIYIFLILKKINWNKLFYVIYSTVLIAGMLTVNKIILLFCTLFPRYSMYINKLTQGDLSNFGGESRGRAIVVSIGFLILILFSMTFFKRDDFKPQTSDKEKVSGKKESLWSFIAITTIDAVIGIMFPTNTLFLRVQSIFSIFEIFFLPAVIERINKKWRGLLYVLSITLFLITTIIKLRSNNCGVNPYEFFWA